MKKEEKQLAGKITGRILIEGNEEHEMHIHMEGSPFELVALIATALDEESNGFPEMVRTAILLVASGKQHKKPRTRKPGSN